MKTATHRDARTTTAIALLATLAIQCGGAVRSSPADDDGGSVSQTSNGEPIGVSGFPCSTCSDSAAPQASIDATIDDGVLMPNHLSPCAGWTEEPTFSTLSSQGQKLGRPFGVWGTSESDMHVALGVEDGRWPSETQIVAVAHWNGVRWNVDPLPAAASIVAISGTSATDLWVVATDSMRQSRILRNNGVGGAWTSSSLGQGFGAAFDMVVLGPEHAIVSARADTNLIGPGSVIDVLDGMWSTVQLPQDNEPYTIMKMSARDATHVYAVGYATGGMMGNFVLDAFNGMAWASVVTPGINLNSPVAAGPVVALEQAVGSSDRVYAIGNAFGPQPTRLLYEISGDLGTWTTRMEIPGSRDEHSLVATTGGTVVAVWGSYMAAGSPANIMQLHGTRATACSLSAGWGQVVALAPPGSPYVHVFAGAQAGITLQPAHHWILRTEP